MSHITDGDLHAYLDKALDAYAPSEAERIRAHLESCADCAQRLDAERALRERAAGILGGADPGAVPLASLEELEARAAATGGSTDHTAKSRFFWRSPYAVGLGWAASITLALFAGYSVRDRAPNPSGRSPAALDPMSELDAVSADGKPEESGRKRDQSRLSEAEALRLPSSGRALQGGVGAATDVAVEAAEAAEDQDLQLDKESPRRRMANADLRERVDAVVRNEAAPVDQPPAPSREVFADARANEARGVAGTMLDARKALEQKGSQEGARAADGLLAITGELRSSGVPGLETGRIDRVELPGLGQAVLVVQILPNGGDLELWSLSTPDLAAASRKTDSEIRGPEIAAYFRSSLPLRWSMTVQERPSGYLVARGLLPQEELDALVERVPDGG